MHRRIASWHRSPKQSPAIPGGLAASPSSPRNSRMISSTVNPIPPSARSQRRDLAHHFRDVDLLRAAPPAGAAAEARRRGLCAGQALDLPRRAADAALVVALDEQRDVQPRRTGVAAIAAAGTGHAERRHKRRRRAPERRLLLRAERPGIVKQRGVFPKPVRPTTCRSSTVCTLSSPCKKRSAHDASERSGAASAQDLRRPAVPARPAARP